MFLFALTGAFIFTLAACGPANETNGEAEPSFVPAQEEATAVPDNNQPVPETPPAREDADAALAPATAVPDAAISLPEENIVTPPPASDSTTPLAEDDFTIMAQEDLAQRLNMAPADIKLIKYEEVEWRDSSLGCPQPKMQYLQVITPGYLIQLEAQGQVYNYHGAAGRPPSLCVVKLGGKELPPIPTPPNKDN